MKQLAVIDDNSLFNSGLNIKKKKYRSRITARAAIFDQQNKLALVHNYKYDYYKLPGGGVKKNESLIAGLSRECWEETGCRISVVKAIGKIIEYRYKKSLKQESYGYIAKVVGKKSVPKFDVQENKEKFELLWVKNVAQAIKLIQNSKKDLYEASFMTARELILLEQLKKMKII
jgi:8-oxo-dGTP diphosphatase